MGQEQGQTPAAQEKTQEFRLYASELTLGRLRAIAPDLEKKLPEWAGRDIAILSRQDMQTVLPPDYDGLGAVDPDKLLWRAAAMREALGKLPGFPSGHRMLDGARPGETFVLSEMFAPAVAGDYAAVRMGPAATGLMFLDTAEPVDGKNMAAGLAGLPPALLGDIPDPEGRRWHLIALAHEAAHLRQDTRFDVDNMRPEMFRADFMHTLELETDADVRAISQYFNIYAAEGEAAQEVPRAFEAMRAIAALRQSHNALAQTSIGYSDHATSAGYEVDGNAATRGVLTAPQVAAGALTVNTYAHALLGITSGPPSEQTVRQIGIMKVSAALPKDGNPLPHPYTENYRRHLMERPDGLQTATALAHGAATAENDALHHYAAVKILHGRGAFDGDPAAREVAEEFLAAFERHVPAAAEQGTLDYIAALSSDTESIDKVMADRNLRAMADGVRSELVPAVPAPAPGTAPASRGPEV